MKPNVMYFDECYSEHYYRTETINNWFENIDCAIIIGTALETNMAYKLTAQSLNREDVPIIEVNMESAINRGLNLQVLGKAEETLPALINAYFAAIGKSPPDYNARSHSPKATNRLASPKAFNAAAAAKAAQDRLRARSPKQNGADAQKRSRSRSPKNFDAQAAAKAAQ